MCAKLLLFFKLPTICKKNTCKKWTTTPKIGQNPISPRQEIYIKRCFPLLKRVKIHHSQRKQKVNPQICKTANPGIRKGGE